MNGRIVVVVNNEKCVMFRCHDKMYYDSSYPAMVMSPGIL